MSTKRPNSDDLGLFVVGIMTAEIPEKTRMTVTYAKNTVTYEKSMYKL